MELEERHRRSSSSRCSSIVATGCGRIDGKLFRVYICARMHTRVCVCVWYKTIYLNAHCSVHQGGGTGGLIDTHCTRHAGVEGEGWWREEKEVKHYTTRHFAKLHHLGGTRSSLSLPRPWDRQLRFRRCAALRASLTDYVARKWRHLRSRAGARQWREVRIGRSARSRPTPPSLFLSLICELFQVFFKQTDLKFNRQGF